MKVQDRGAFFTKPGDEVYEDQIIGINAKAGDLKVNACKTKALTNMRSAGADEKSNVTPPMQLTLEDAVEYVVVEPGGRRGAMDPAPPASGSPAPRKPARRRGHASPALPPLATRTLPDGSRASLPGAVGGATAAVGG